MFGAVQIQQFVSGRLLIHMLLHTLEMCTHLKSVDLAAVAIPYCTTYCNLSFVNGHERGFLWAARNTFPCSSWRSTSGVRTLCFSTMRTLSVHVSIGSRLAAFHIVPASSADTQHRTEKQLNNRIGPVNNFCPMRTPAGSILRCKSEPDRPIAAHRRHFVSLRVV